MYYVFRLLNEKTKNSKERQSMSKVIKYDTDVTEKLLSGVEKTTAIVSKTMGPVASNVIISRRGAPRITKDGITVIRNIEFED